MANHSTHHALDQGARFGEDPYDRYRMNQPIPEPYPSGGLPPAGIPTPNQWPGYGPTQQAHVAPNSDVAYNAAPQESMGYPGDNTMTGLASQMGGLGIGATDARTHKRRHRHAYHDIGSAQQPPSGSFSQESMQPSSQFLNTGVNQASRPVSRTVGPAPGMIPQPGVPGAGAGRVSTQGKVDPEAIPSIPRTRDVSTVYYNSRVYPTMERHLPPPAGIPFVAYDQGNSSPKFARLTLNNIPSTSDFLSSTGMPMGMILQPLAHLDPSEQPVPVLDFGDLGPPRCRRCRAYMNPFMTFRSGGNSFICNMCTFPNDVPPEYFAPLEPSGVRTDRLQRPELMMGTVEYLVPKEYWNKEPVGLQWLFLIDVSSESVKRGFPRGVCKGILEALYGSDDEALETTEANRKLPQGSKVGIATFDSDVHFYNLNVRGSPSLGDYKLPLSYNALGATRSSADDGNDRFGRAICSIK